MSFGFQRALPIAFTGAAGTGKTRAGLELPRLVNERLQEKKVSILVVHRAVRCGNIQFAETNTEKRKCAMFVALMLSKGATTDFEEALRILVAERETSGMKGMLVLLHVDEFQEDTQKASAFLRTVRDWVGEFVTSRILLIPVLSGFDATDVATDMAQVSVSHYTPKVCLLRTFSLEEAKGWARPELGDSAGEVDTPSFLAALQATGCVPRFVEDAVDIWQRFEKSLDSPKVVRADMFKAMSDELVSRYGSHFARLENARPMLLVSALQRQQVNVFASVARVLLAFSLARVSHMVFVCRSHQPC